MVVEEHPEPVEEVVSFGLAEVVLLVALVLGADPAVRVRDLARDGDVYEMFLEVAVDDAFGLVMGIHAKVSAACVEMPCHVQGSVR